MLGLLLGGMAHPSPGPGPPQAQPRDLLLAPACAGVEGLFGGSTSVGDLNGDGNPDLLMSGRTRFEKQVRLYWGNGTGGFTEAEAELKRSGSPPTSIADLNGDGNPDVLLGPALYLGDQTGHFRKVQTGLPEVKNGSVSVGDLDGDGNLDVLMTGQRAGDVPDNPIARVYLGNGTGGFTAGAGLRGVSFGSTSIGDVNKDGNPDLLITGDTDLGTDMTPSTTLYLGNGDGEFTETDAGLMDVSHNGSTSIGDVNGDGNPDLLITGVNADSDPSATLYLGNGQGRFKEAEADLTPIAYGATAMGDVDGDGNADVLLTGKTRNDNPASRLYFGRGDGTFETRGVGLSGVRSSSAAMARIDGDGRPDLVVRGRRPNQASGSGILENQVSVSTIYLTDLGKRPQTTVSALEANEAGSEVDLSWRVACEMRNTGFAVQRRTGNAPSWQRVGFVESKVAGEAVSSELSYEFSDGSLPYGADSLSYRLRPIETEGAAPLSETVRIRRSVNTVQFPAPVPNPAQSVATIRYAVPPGQSVTLRLYNALGRRVRTLRRAGDGGRGELQVGVSGLSSGLYFLRLRSGRTVRTRRLTVMR